MTHAVGLRTYQIFITKKGGQHFVSPTDSELNIPLPELLRQFVFSKRSGEDNTEQEKLWSMEERLSLPSGCSAGIIAYGRYGFAASLRNIRTGEDDYRRTRHQAEMLNLYYRFWFPEYEKYALAAFQSFSGRSCITLLLKSLKDDFEIYNPRHQLRIRKLLPAGASAAIYAGKEVQSLKLVTSNPSNDIADQLFRGKANPPKRLSVTVHARRNGYLGSFEDLIAGLSESASVIQHDGMEFDEAVAMVRIGNELKPVGVFGAHSEVGVVDITADVVIDEDGLPTFESVDFQARNILGAIYNTVSGQRM